MVFDHENVTFSLIYITFPKMKEKVLGFPQFLRINI